MFKSQIGGLALNRRQWPEMGPEWSPGPENRPPGMPRPFSRLWDQSRGQKSAKKAKYLPVWGLALGSLFSIRVGNEQCSVFGERMFSSVFCSALSFENVRHLFGFCSCSAFGCGCVRIRPCCSVRFGVWVECQCRMPMSNANVECQCRMPISNANVQCQY